MTRPSSAVERELIQEQLTQAKKTLARLRQISDSPKPSENGSERRENPRNTMSRDLPTYHQNGETRSTSSSRSEDRRYHNSQPRISTAARDNLVHALGYQVSKLEDDLKASLLSYFEQVERQKEELIDSFNVMQKQLLNHQQTYQEQNQEAAEKDAFIRQLKDEKRRLENQVERLQSEKNTLDNSSFIDGLDSSLESINSDSLSYATSTQNNSGYASDKSEMCENFLQENARLREMLRQQDNIDCSRLERKVDLQKQLCNSYDKDLASKDILIKRLKAENKGLQSDVQSMQDEVLRVNRSRLNAEQEKTKLQQDIQFKEDEMFALREKLAEAIEDREEMQRIVEQGDLSKTSNGDISFSSFDEDVFELQSKCGSYKEKLQDKEKFINSMKRDQQERTKALDTLRKELAEANNEIQRMKRENERLQKENADRDIDRLSNESSSKASVSRINQLKDTIAEAEQEIKELQHKCQESEKREADLSHDVLSNLEKYTRAEQELYTTKKELAHLRGHSESNERTKNEIQRELLSARENICRLEKELQAKNSKHHLGNLDDLESENNQLKEELARYDDALNSNKLELNQLENDIESLREQCSIQKVRLDGQETMIMRKDERIKELQDELVELHNQNDALTDEILKKNREYGSLKMSKRLAEQESELLKTGKVPMSSSYSQEDNALARQPSASDSRFSDTDGQRWLHNREQLTEKSNAQLHRKSDDETDNHYEFNKLIEENASLKGDNAEMLSTLNEMQTSVENMEEKLRQFEDKERMMLKQFEDKENGLLKTLDDMQEKLSGVLNENNELAEKVKDMERDRDDEEDSQQRLTQYLTFNDQLDALESTPVGDLLDMACENTKTKQSINVPVVQQEQVLDLEDGANEQLIDFDEPFYERTEAVLESIPETNEETDNETTIANLKDEIKTYEAQIESVSEDKKELETEVEQLRQLLEQTQHECEMAKQETDVFKKNSSKNISDKDKKVATLEKELKSAETNCDKLQNNIKTLEKYLEEKEESLLSAQEKCNALENKAAENKKKYEEMKKIADTSNDEEYLLVNDLELTKAKLIDLENEIAESQAETMKAVNKCRELQRGKRNMEEDIEQLQKEKNKMDKKLKDLETEKDDAMQKYENAKQQIKELKSEQRRLQEDKDDLDFDLNEMLKHKSREIKKLTEDLEVSDNKYEDLRASWDSSSAVSSDLKSELLKAKEECADLTNKNEKLYGFKKELIKDLEDKEKQIENLRTTEEDLRNGINTREKELEKLREKCKDLQEDNTTLQEERVDLRKAIDVTSVEQKAVDTQVEKLKERLEKAESRLKEDQDKNSVLRETVEKNEHENDVLKEKLNKIEKRLVDLQKREENAQTELLNAEKRAKASEKKVKELTNTLNKDNEDIGYLQNKLTKAENTILSLEEAQTSGEEQQKTLQRKLLDATNQIGELKSQEKDYEERQKNNDKRFIDLRNYNEELEAERDDLEFSVKELKKKLEKQKKKVETLEDELVAKQDEKDFVAQELDLLKRNLSETETEQSANVTEREKLKKDMLEASKKIMDLEAEIDAQNENIEELEKLLDQKRATVLDLEDNVKETTETSASLQTQHDEDKRLIRSLQEDNANLEKMLEKQRQLSEGYKSSLSQKDAEISKLVFNRDETEDTLLLTKKDLVRMQGVSKADREELEEVEKHLIETSKKLQETKLTNENLSQENEILKKELDNARRKLAELDGIQAETFVPVLDVEPLSSRKSSSSSILSVNVADSRIKTLDDKLTKAQTKVTDLENELSKEIRRHEIDCIKTRPTFPFSYGGKRSGFYDVSGFNEKYGLPKKSESSDSDFSSNTDDTGSKYRGSYKMKKSMDSSDPSLERGSDVESKVIEKSLSVASSTPPQSPVVSVFNYDSSNEPVNQDPKKGNQMDSLTIQRDNDSESEATSRGDGDDDADDEVFEHSIGNLNDLLSEMNEAEKHDPILQQYLLLDEAVPEETSSPRNDSFDAIQPTYLTRREQPKKDSQEIHPEENKSDVNASTSSEFLLDLTASDITTVTDVIEPTQKNNQLLLDFDTLDTPQRDERSSKQNKQQKKINLNSSNERQLNIEKPSACASDQSCDDVIDPFSTPFDIPNWEDEYDSSFDIDSSKEMLSDNGRLDNQFMILDQGKDDTDNVPNFKTKAEIDVGNDLLIELREQDKPPAFKEVTMDINADSSAYDLEQTKPKNTAYHKTEKTGELAEATDDRSSDEERMFRKPSEIIKRLEDSSFTIGKPGTKPPRPKRREDQTPVFDDPSSDSRVTQKPEPKPRGKPSTQQRTEDEERSKETEVSAPVPAQRYIDLDATDEEQPSTEEDRYTAIGRERVMKLIRAFEGKEV